MQRYSMKSMQLLLLVILLMGWGTAISEGVEGGDSMTVSLKQGDIETSKTVAKDGKQYYTFKGIPFAKPPTGNLRFKNPEPADSWSGVRSGSIESDACPQQQHNTAFGSEDCLYLNVYTPGNPEPADSWSGVRSGSIESDACPQQQHNTAFGSEDCLYLNVYTPGPQASDLPVMVWIHGGAFLWGSAKEYDPRPLMTGDVVVVVIQYRLGTFAFLSTEDSVMPGNYGLKDQVMALKWVQENIQAFGGDSNSVTIFGESAGAMSVHFLMLSPMAEGLFHRAIAQSGTALVPGIIRNDHKEIATQVGQIVECKDIDTGALDSAALHNCLKEVPQDVLTLIPLRFAKLGEAPQVMRPSVDGEFFPEHPVQSLKEGKYKKVDFMTGITKNEGAFMTRLFLPNSEMMNELEQNFSTNGQYILPFGSEGMAKDYIPKRIFFKYIGELKLSEENADGVMKMFGDIWFNIPLDLTAEFHARGAAYGEKIFLYEFHHLGQNSFLRAPSANYGQDWVGHLDEVQYLFDTPLIRDHLEEPKDLFMSDIMTSLWINFVKTGNPTPDLSLGFKWEALSDSKLKFLVLEPLPYMRGSTRDEEKEFLTNLPTSYNKRIFPERFVMDPKA